LQLRRAGYSAEELRHAGVGPRELRACGFSMQELRSAGFSASVLAEVNRALHAAFSVGDYSALPQLHPRLQRSAGTPSRAAPRALTPTIREHTDWMPKMSANAEPSQSNLRKSPKSPKRIARAMTIHGMESMGVAEKLQSSSGSVSDAKARAGVVARRRSLAV